MSQVVIENPIINCPFEEPARHFRFDEQGITNTIVRERRISQYFVPIAKPRKTAKDRQLTFDEWTEDRIEENKTVNAIRRLIQLWREGRYTDSILIVTPGITIRDRLRVLLPSDPANYYRALDLVPPDLMDKIAHAKIVITNFHAFRRREKIKAAALTKAILHQGEDSPFTESEGEMVRRVCRAFGTKRNILAINDEAHHCYRRKPDGRREKDMDEVICYAKNHGLGFFIPYTIGGVQRNYVPDFIAHVDDGHGPDDLLNLIIEVTGAKDKDKEAKVAAAQTLWVPAVNNAGTWDRWAFVEIRDPWDAQSIIREFLAERLLAEK